MNNKINRYKSFRTCWWFIKILVVLVISTSCDPAENYFVDPIADFSMSSNEVSVGEIVNFYNHGQGNVYTVFTGDVVGSVSHNYDDLLIDSLDRPKGIEADVDGNFSYTYTKGGTYTVTYLVSSYNLAEDIIKKDIQQKEIVVIDSAVSFKTYLFNSQNYGFVKGGKQAKFLFEGIPNNQNQIIVPIYHWRRLLFEKRPEQFTFMTSVTDYFIKPNINLDIELTIEGHGIFTQGDTVNHLNEAGTDFESKTYSFKNAQGVSTNYDVIFAMIPEFASYSVAGQSVSMSLIPNSKLNIDETNYQRFFINLVVADTVNLTNQTAEFTTLEPVKSVKVNNTEQVSGITTNDFTNPVTYFLTVENSGIEVQSEVIVTLTK